MKIIIFDIETSGLDCLAKGAKIHVTCTQDFKTGEKRTFKDVNLAVDYLNTADLIVGHYVQFFDINWIEHISGRKLTAKPYDTKIIGSLMFPELQGHQLKDWGNRLGLEKQTEFTYTDFSICTPEMIEQCIRDVEITARLYRHLSEQDWSKESVELETEVADIINNQIKRGVCFDEKSAQMLYAELAGKSAELKDKMKKMIPARYKRICEIVPKRDNKTLGYTKDCPYTKVEYVEFNPSSNEHITYLLLSKGWKPTKFTPTGKPSVDESVLSELTFTEARLLSEISTVDKILGMLGDGSKAWLKLVKNGRIHGRVFTTGTVTGRMSAGDPNLQQVPASGKPYGKECRALFTASKGNAFVGADASGLELRCLAHYLAKYDYGKFSKIILEGDIHWANAVALFDISEAYDADKKQHKEFRDLAKRFIYAFLYGAGNNKLAAVLSVSEHESRKIRARFLRALPALDQLIKDVQRASQKGYLVGLDKRKVYIRSEHAALNTLLQSAGAVIMKKALTMLPKDVNLVLTVHDEWQFDVSEDIAYNIGELAVKAIRDTGEFYNLRCKLDGEFKIGKNWRDTH